MKMVVQIEQDPQYDSHPEKRSEILESYANLSETFEAFKKFTAVNC